MKCKDFLGGVFVGAVFGTLAGLLLAPQSGAETRDVVCKSAKDISEKLKESSLQLVESGRDLLEQGKTHVSSLLRTPCENVDHPTAEEPVSKS
jgi:gas vesicle protein